MYTTGALPELSSKVVVTIYILTGNIGAFPLLHLSLTFVIVKLETFLLV